MKKVVIYWKKADRERKREAKIALGVADVSVNGESVYKGDLGRLEPYIKEGLIEVRVKEHEEVKRKKMAVVDSGGVSFKRKTSICVKQKK